VDKGFVLGPSHADAIGRALQIGVSKKGYLRRVATAALTPAAEPYQKPVGI
jgi:hypothetical protein